MDFGFLDLLNLLGSLGLFLVGMKIMSDSLMELAGNKMRRIMAGLTSNRFKGMFTGIFITGLIQSSSSTTLMVVSFVNAGLLKLTEALSVIMGANIGTTLTAWLIAVLGFKISMSDIALPLMIFGFAFSMREDQQVKSFGGFIIGFSLLFIGLDFMKAGVPDLQSSPAVFEFIQVVSGYGAWSLLLFLVVGTLLTLVLQSSSATMAITLVATSQGWLPFEAACAIVLGENVGTTITANLAALVANTNARRAALSHLVFNLIGVIWVLLLFTPFIGLVSEIVVRLPGESAIAGVDPTIGLAVFHTTFNIINTFLLIGFIGPIAALVTRVLTETEIAEPPIDQPKYLDEDLLRYPQTAIAAVLKETRRLYREPMYEVVMHSINLHRHHLETSTSREDLVAGSRAIISMDFDDFVARHIRPIYAALIGYGTEIHKRFALEETEEEQLRRLGNAARDALQIAAKAEQYSKELNKFMNDKNDVVRMAVDAQRLDFVDFIGRLAEIDSEPDKELVDSKLDGLKKWAKKHERKLSKKIGEQALSGDIPIDISASLYSAARLFELLCNDFIRITRNLHAANIDIEANGAEPEQQAA